MSWKIPLADLDFGQEESEAVQKVLDSRWLTMGGMTQQFEAEFAEYSKVRHAIAVTNCTVGLHLACVAANVGPGDEVIVPSLSFVATANAVRYTGAIPVFADITGENDLTISPEAIEACITPRTKAIMVMHYGGYACNMSRILEIAEKHHLIVLEDAAHSAGSWLDGQSLGTIGAIGCYSFFSNKNMTTGEGGIVVTNDDDLAERLRLLRSHGMTSLTWDRHRGHAWSYDVVDLGFNYRIDEIRAAIGLAQLHKLPANNARRLELTGLYREVLRELAPQAQIPFDGHAGTSACHILPVLLPEGVVRTQFMESMKEQGIQTSIHYPPTHTFTYYRQNADQEVHLPVTEAVGGREVTLPLYPGMTNDNVLTIGEAVRTALKAVEA